MKKMRTRLVAITVGTLIMSVQSNAQQGEPDAPGSTQGANAEAIKAITDRTNVLQAQKDLIDAQKSIIDAMFPSFGDKFGKSGEATIESGEGDKFHATSKSAEALREAAGTLYAAVAAASENKKIALVTDDDRRSISAYIIARKDVESLGSSLQKIIDEEKQTQDTKGVGLAPYAVGQLLSEIAQFTKLFRTDHSLFFTTPNLPEQLFVDLVAASAKGKQEIIYPAAGLDVTFSQEGSPFLQLLKSLGDKRAQLSSAATNKNKDLLDHYEKFMSALLAVDDSKFPLLFYVIRGESATNAIKEAEGRILTVKLTHQAGTTMRVSSVWRRDRLFASGGVIVSYRYTDGATVVTADVVTVDAGLSEIPLGSP